MSFWRFALLEDGEDGVPLSVEKEGMETDEPTEGFRLRNTI